MQSRPETLRRALLLALRNLLLYSLLVASWLQLREAFDLPFQSAAFLLGLLAALAMARARLRFLPALLLAAALPFLLRELFFLVFRLQRLVASAPATDFLFFLFDKDFFAALVPWTAAWLLNFLALRRPGFVVVEAGVDAALLVLALWPQAGYRVTLVPHPSILAWALAAFVVAAMAVLLLSRGERPGLRPVMGFAWVVVPLLLLSLFFVLGKYREGAVAAGGGLMKPTLFRFDFAPYVRLEPRIRMGDDLVLLFRTEGEADRFLLRRFVLSGYEPRRGFFVDTRGGIDEAAAVVPDSPEDLPDPGYRGRVPLQQEYFFLALDPTSLVAVNYPTRVAPLQNWTSSSFLRVYRVLSRALRAPERADRVTAQPAMDPVALALYTRSGDDPAIRELALQVTRDSAGYAAKVRAIERHLQEQYLYSLEPGMAADGNQLRHFLFESRKGYCSYFAFAMTLLCRSIGIPARVAVGFLVDPRFEALNFYEVRAFQAHAWVEVWFGELGWVEFDPTSQELAPGERFDFFAGPDRERLSKLIAEILQNQDAAEQQAIPRDGAAARGQSAAAGLARAFLLLARLWYLTLPALYALFLLAVKLLPSLPGLLSADPRRRVRAWYRLCMVRLGGVGLGRLPAESYLEHARRIGMSRGIRLEPLAQVFLRAVFAEGFAAADRAEARAARAGFTSSFRAAVPLPLRALGLLNPAGWMGAPRAAWLLLCLALLAAAPAGVEAQEAPELDRLSARAREAIERESYETAVRILTEAKGKFPGAPQLNIELADLYYEKELYQLALEEYREAERKGAADRDTLTQIARCYGKLNRESSSIAYLERIVKEFPEAASAWDDLGWMYFKTRQLEKGERVLREGIGKFGLDMNMAMTLGTVYSGMYRYESSKRYYLEAVGKAVEAGDTVLAAIAYYNLSLLERNFYRYNSALRDTDESLAMEERASGHLARGELLESRMEFRSALAEYELAAATDTTPLSRVNLALLYRKFGMLDLARRYAEEVLATRDLAWMLYYGTDVTRHSRDVHELLADLHEGLARTAVARPTTGPGRRIAALLEALRHRVVARHHRLRFRIASLSVGRSCLAQGSLEDAWLEFYRANEAYPGVALKYLALARELETARAPHAEAFYLREEGTLRRSADLLARSIEGFDPFWEKDAVAESLRRMVPLLGGRADGGRRREAVERLFEINPGALLQSGLGLPLETAFEGPGWGAREKRLIGRYLKRAHSPPQERARHVLRLVRGDGEETRITVTDRRTGRLVAETAVPPAGGAGRRASRVVQAVLEELYAVR
jgi:transglutaminase-like putative cysteine protease